MSRWFRLALFAALFTCTLGVTAQSPDTKKADDKKPSADTKKTDDKKADDKKADDKKAATKPTDEKKSTEKDAKKESPRSVLKVLVPLDTAEVTIEKQVMKTTGKTREYELPPLEAGKPFEYDISVKFEPNNYTTITRKKTIKFKGGDAVVTADFMKEDPSDRIVIRWVPTPEDVVAEMMKLGKVTKDDIVYDLGCGDGVILLGAIKAGAKRAVGIDLDPAKVKEAKENAKKQKLEDKVEIRQGDVLDIKDLSDATVVTIYMSDELGKLLEPILKKTLKPGSRIVSHRFTLGDWKPEKTITVTGQDGDEYTLHLWTVPQK